MRHISEAFKKTTTLDVWGSAAICTYLSSDCSSASCLLLPRGPSLPLAKWKGGDTVKTRNVEFIRWNVFWNANRGWPNKKYPWATLWIPNRWRFTELEDARGSDQKGSCLPEKSHRIAVTLQRFAAHTSSFDNWSCFVCPPEKKSSHVDSVNVYKAETSLFLISRVRRSHQRLTEQAVARAIVLAFPAPKTLLPEHSVHVQYTHTHTHTGQF